MGKEADFCISLNVYFGFLSANARMLSAKTLEAVGLALRSASQESGGADRELVRLWEQLRDEPSEDGPPGWFAAIYLFCDLAGEVTGEFEPRASLMYVTDTAAKLPEAEPGVPAVPHLVRIDFNEEVEEDSPRAQMLRKFGRVAQLAGERARQELPCVPDEIRAAVFG